MRILFVCLGNICRSPLADGLLRRKIADQNLDALVDSAGTANYHVGQAPDSRMIATARKFGTDISFLRGRQFTKKDFNNFDLIYVMDESNYSNVKKLASTEQEERKIHFLLNELLPGSNDEVPDPYYGGQEDFDYVYSLLDAATDKIIEKIKQQ